MSKFDGLVWKKGHDGWKDIPAGIGYVPKDFDPQNDDACLRVEDQVKAGYGGKKVDFRNINDLLIACPPEGVVSEANPPKIIYAAVHPTNLKAAIIVWSAPVIMLDPSKISGGIGSPSLNGRVMTFPINGVKIDGSDPYYISIEAGAVGAYGTIDDPDQATVVDTTSKMYAGSKNDTSVGDDQTSQTTGQKIPLFVPCDHESFSVSVSFTYKVEDAVQSCGEPHKIWGACYCIWGSTAPMEVFPFGTVMDLTPANLGPPASFYGGTVAAGAFVDRGATFDIAVVGVAGPVILVGSANDTSLPLQPGQVVSFQTYLCDYVCSTPKTTKLHHLDEALAYVDEDIIKPKERILPVYTFLEVTYYRTEMDAITSTEIPAMSELQLPTASFTRVWSGTEVYGKAVQWNSDLRLPAGEVRQVSVVELDPAITEWIVLTKPTEVLVYTPVVIPPGPINVALDPVAVGLVKGDGLIGQSFLSGIVPVACHKLPTGTKVVSGSQPPKADIKQLAGAAFTARFVPASGAVITAAEERISVALTTYSVDKFPANGKVITSIGTTTLTVCGPGGASVVIEVVTAIGTAGPAVQNFNALSAISSFEAVTHVPTGPPDAVPITTYSEAPGIHVVTEIALDDPIPVVAFSGVPFSFQTTQALVPNGFVQMVSSLVAGELDVGYVPYRGVIPTDVFIVTGSAAPPHIDLTKFETLVDFTAFDPASAAKLKVMAPREGVVMKLPIIDKEKKIPFLDVTGPPDKAVKLLVSDIHGDLKLVGMGDPLIIKNTIRTPKGMCTGGSTGVLSPPGGPYENDGEIKLLAPLPVNKSRGNSETCPCFTTADPDGGPVPPADNSAVTGPNPCTLRVRRLQLSACHR